MPQTHRAEQAVRPEAAGQHRHKVAHQLKKRVLAAGIQPRCAYGRVSRVPRGCLEGNQVVLLVEQSYVYEREVDAYLVMEAVTLTV